MSNEQGKFERRRRASVGALDDILGDGFMTGVGDGFVRVVDYMGNDAAIVQAARISYGEGTKHINEDRGLIRYCMRHRHTTPFEMCEIKLHVRVPMDLWRQWIRHRTANVNEYSTRYSEAIDAMALTRPDKWRLQSGSNKQGSGGYLDHEVGVALTEKEVIFQQRAREVYEQRIEQGVAREQARKDLPLSTMTEAYWKIDLHNLLHFLGLRMEAHAQEEIRTYANIIGNEIVARWCPLVWQGFLDYRFNAINFSAMELQVLAAAYEKDWPRCKELAVGYGWLPEPGEVRKSNRERDEVATKLARLGIDIGWLQ